MTEKISILFVCTANRYRSPFAEVVFRQKLTEHGMSDQWLVGSAGTWTHDGLPAVPHVIRKAHELGLDLSERRSVEVDDSFLSVYDLVLVMEKGHKEALWVEFPKARLRVFLLSEVVDGVAYDVPDPARFPKEADQIMDELYQLLERGFEKIVQQAARLAQSAAP